MTLSWNASTDNVGVTGYDAYRNSAMTGSTAAGTRTYTFGGLTCGTSYTLGVEARDAAGNRSGRATITGATSPCTPPPHDAASHREHDQRRPGWQPRRRLHAGQGWLGDSAVCG